MTIALQALSLVEKEQPVRIHFTLRLRDQGSKWIPGGALHVVFEDHVRSSPYYMGAMYVNFVDYYRPMFT
jgi:hypothetical protein